jgi:hypothetical protein
MVDHEEAREVRQLPTVQIKFAPICLDPTQIGVLTAGQTEPETLDAYIRRVVGEEVRKIRAGVRAVGMSA